MQQAGKSVGRHAPDHVHDFDALLEDGGADTTTVLYEGFGSIGVTQVGGTTGGTGSTFTTTTPSSGFVINVNYDSSVANAPAGFTTVVGQVVQYFESHFFDPVTININVGYGEVNGSSLPAGDIGASYTYFNLYSYATIVN